MRFVANPVVVEAFRILKVGPTDPQGMVLELEERGPVVATPGMLARMEPVPGDFWVVQEDGYVYLNPRSIFLRKYSPIEATCRCGASGLHDCTQGTFAEAV